MKPEILHRASFDDDAETSCDISETLSIRLRSFDFYLGFLKKRFKDPAVRHGVVADIERFFRAYSEPALSWTGVRADMLDPLPNLSGKPELAEGFAHTYLSLMRADSYRDFLTTGRSEISTNDFLRPHLWMLFFEARALETCLPKCQALVAFEEYTDMHTAEIRKPAHVDSLQQLVETPMPPPFCGSFDYIAFKLGKGKVGMYVSRCRWAEIMSEIADSEYAYACICHYDFAAAPVMNPNFILTRTKTLARGDRCCDFIWHDRRYDSALDHPSDEFWEMFRGEYSQP